MSNAHRISLLRFLLAVGATALGCSTRPGLQNGTGGRGIGGLTGTGGAAGMSSSCAGPSDERLVVAPQRILRLTMTETLNTIRYLIDDTEARPLVTDGVITGYNDTVDSQRVFPPLQESHIIGDIFVKLDVIADHVAKYVLANFAPVTACPTATDACATAYLDKLAARAYRRPLTPDEQSRFTALYTKLRSTQTVNGYEVTFTVEEATSYAVNALLMSPQLLWRWEHGDPAMASTSPAGIPLTEHELATHLSFFLTDQPPSDALLAAASAGTLRANLTAHVETLLASQTAQDWLRTIIETYFLLNQLPFAPVDRAMFPVFTPSLIADMGVEARKFLDNVLWHGELTDLLRSRTAFLNSSLAVDIYGVPVPAGATETTFIATTLPANRRAGLLTNAALLATRGRADGRNLVVPRGKAVASMLLCMAPNDDAASSSATQPFKQQTSHEQVAFRAAQPFCNDCHGLFDPYGLALDNYDTLGRYRTVDELGRPIDAHATLAPALGGATVANAVQLAQVLATRPEFTNCMARTVLQYAMVDYTAPVQIPSSPEQPGCATVDVVQRYQRAGGKTFGDLVRATAATPAFVLRRAEP